MQNKTKPDILQQWHNIKKNAYILLEGVSYCDKTATGPTHACIRDIRWRPKLMTVFKYSVAWLCRALENNLMLKEGLVLHGTGEGRMMLGLVEVLVGCVETGNH